jgi:hypothetical protein
MSEAKQLIAEAEQYLGQLYVVSDGRGNVLEESEFVGTKHEDESEEPLAVFKSKGKIWTKDLNDTLALYRIWNKK